MSSFATVGQIRETNPGLSNTQPEHVQMASYAYPDVPPPKYELDHPDTLAHKWWDVRAWSKKKLMIVGGVLLAIIIILAVVIGVEVSKANRYPNYSQLSYSLKDTYSGTDFFDNFEYFNTYDPTSGFVHYVSSADASQYNLTYATNSSAIVKVDTSVTADSTPNASTGRFSVRIESKKQYADGLFIFDVKHTPTGCATWPALWLSDSNNWPTNGEIDIMEAVNVIDSTKNQMTLHTSSGCSMGVKRKETGSSIHSSCANTTNDNAGCGVYGAKNTFGADLNDAGGAVMAMELRSAGIRVWQFGRDEIPSDIDNGNPDPSTWSEAQADFPSTDCNIGNHFRNQSIIVNIDLCGTWAGATGVYDESCPGVCTDYVANNATAFKDSYWEFGEFKIYQAS